MNDPTVSPLIAEIHRLQYELDVANESIDDKLDKLEDAGLGVVGLTEKLEDARTKISRLEDEIARLSRKEERWSMRLARIRCKKCNIKVDLGHLANDERCVGCYLGSRLHTYSCYTVPATYQVTLCPPITPHRRQGPRRNWRGSCRLLTPAWKG